MLKDLLKLLTFAWLFNNAGGCLKWMFTIAFLAFLFILYSIGFIQ